MNCSVFQRRLSFCASLVFVFCLVSVFVACKTAEGNRDNFSSKSSPVRKQAPLRQLPKRPHFFVKDSEFDIFFKDGPYLDSLLKEMGGLRYFLPSVRSLSFSLLSQEDAAVIVADGDFSNIGQKRALLKSGGAVALKARNQNQTDAKEAWRYFERKDEDQGSVFFDIGYQDTIVVLSNNAGSIDSNGLDLLETEAAEENTGLSEPTPLDIRDIEWKDEFPDLVKETRWQESAKIWLYAARGEIISESISAGGDVRSKQWIDVDQWFFLAMDTFDVNGEAFVSMLIPLNPTVSKEFGSLIKPIIPLLLNSFEVDMISSLPDVKLKENYLMIRDIKFPKEAVDEFLSF